MDLVTLALAKKYTKDSIEGAGAIQGKSAYQIAVDKGFSGTEQEWLNSLKGEDYVITESDKTEIADMIKDDVNELREDLTAKIDKPTEAPTVGKILRVKQVNEDGSFVCEWADGGAGGGVNDVLVDRESVVSADGAAVIPVANGTDVLGVVKANSTYGVQATPTGRLITVKAPDAVIVSRNDSYRPIVPANVVPAVNSVLCSTAANEQLTAEQQLAARQRLGAVGGKYELVATYNETVTEDTTIDIHFPDCTDVLIEIVVDPQTTISNYGTAVLMDGSDTVSRIEFGALAASTYRCSAKIESFYDRGLRRTNFSGFSSVNGRVNMQTKSIGTSGLYFSVKKIINRCYGLVFNGKIGINFYGIRA